MKFVRYAEPCDGWDGEIYRCPKCDRKVELDYEEMR